MATVTNLATGDYIDETWVDSVTTGLNTGTFSGTYTPTIQGMAVGTGGSANNTAYYSYVGGILVVQGIIQFGTTGVTFPTAPNIFVPSGFTASQPIAPNYATIGHAAYVCSGTSYHGYMTMVSQTIARPMLYTASGTYPGSANLGVAVPVTWVSGDYMRYSFTLVGTMT